MSTATARTIRPAPVRKELHVKVPPERAFEVFTAGFARWWPGTTHHIGAATYKTAVLEPRVGGRWYEIGDDGSACEWGDVLAWEPPHRLVLAWRITADWQYDASLTTEVEVIFTAEAGGTRVALEHRGLENWGERAAAMRTAIDSDGGWAGILKQYAEFVDHPQQEK
jgi:uncharacterized protein YndB with AHSA1/START domain